ncbi:glycosyltransferase [Phreatobacter sp.]|uniref:glycosyltransferase n=1 Tax=Phreatobacter sp. TaxID=1966341 RepID=UPI003F70DCFA
MATPIALDLTRLFVSILRGRPRGIERVDFAFAEAALQNADRPLFGIIGYPWGPRVLDRLTVERLVRAVRNVWAEDQAVDDDSSFRQTRRWLLGFGNAPARSGRATRLPGDLVKAASTTRFRRGSEIGSLPTGSVYLNVGQVGFAVDRATGWLGTRPDVKVVSFLHDLLPLRAPEWFEASSDSYFARVLERMLDRSQVVVLATEVLRRQLQDHCRQTGRVPPPVIVQPLAPMPALAYREAFDPDLASAPYMVICGTIESRKNHLMPLLLWRDSLMAGRPMPKLVVAGGRGWGASEAWRLLDRSAAIRSHVVEVAGLSSPALMHLIAHSRALLAPAFSEGFGLPVVEALTLNVPVLASDIPVFRETAAGHATLLDPLDGPGWAGAIDRLAWRLPGRDRGRPAGYSPARPEAIACLLDSLCRES